jgi:hypothetical protein
VFQAYNSPAAPSTPRVVSGPQSPPRHSIVTTGFTGLALFLVLYLLLRIIASSSILIMRRQIPDRILLAESLGSRWYMGSKHHSCLLGFIGKNKKMRGYICVMKIRWWSGSAWRRVSRSEYADRKSTYSGRGWLVTLEACNRFRIHVLHWARYLATRFVARREETRTRRMRYHTYTRPER